MAELPVHVSKEVDLDDMAYVEQGDGSDEESGLSYFELACRCGDSFRVTENELDAGVDVIGCRACSLHVRVLFSVAADHSDQD
jgi:diphthamide biosynthesis protein 4